MFRFETSWLRQAAIALAPLLALLPVHAHGWQAQGPQSQEVRDTATGLVWRRCAEGMYWTGDACAGQAVLLDWSQAQARARAMAQADGQAWRLPTLAQLKLLGAFARSQAAAHAALFPQSPPGWYWSASSTVDNAPVNPYNYGNIQRGVDGSNVSRLTYLQAWALQLGDGDAQDNLPKRSALHVRLVRLK